MRAFVVEVSALGLYRADNIDMALGNVDVVIVNYASLVAFRRFCPEKSTMLSPPCG